MAGSLIYPGAHRIKDTVRDELYRAIETAWAGNRPGGDAVVLCGPEPRDADGLSQLGFSKESCWFVDRQPHGLRAAKKLWPTTNVFCGEISSLLVTLNGPALVNLDLMEQATEEVEELVVLGASRLCSRGVLALTFVRGREHSLTQMKSRLMAVGASTFDEARWELIRRMMRHAGGREIYSNTYKDNRVAMGVIAVQV